MRFYLMIAALVALAAASTPSSFDARSKWSHCDFKILDQGRCGSCWDFSSMEAFSDRACISGEASSGTIMSPEPILQCSGSACGGGNPHTAWNWVISNGDATCTSLCKSGCAPYDSYSCKENGACSSCKKGKCDSGSSWPKKYTASKYESLSKGAISTFQKELMDNGPLQACFTEYSNFQSYFNQHPTGIYTETSGSKLGGHCVKMIGWGESGGTPYWTFANSWSTSFGDKGYFKMLRGKNLCGIENQVSEGFTSKQKATLEAQGRVFYDNVTVSDEILGGGWMDQEDMDFDLFVEASKWGLDEISIKLNKPVQLKKNLNVRTQVVNGVNFNILAQTDQRFKVSMQLYRSPQMEWELESYDILMTI